MKNINNTPALILSALLSFTLLSCSTGYVIQGSKVEFEHWNEGHGQMSDEVVGADINSFQELQYYYAKEKNHVWYRGNMVKNAHAGSFQALDDAYLYAKDKSNAYRAGKIIENANGPTFKVLKKGYSKDYQYLFYQTGGFKFIKPCDIKTLKIVDDRFPSRALDSQCYYYGLKVVPIKDRKSLKIFQYSYAADKYAVYFSDHVIKEADPNTFKLVETRNDNTRSHYPMDKNGCYRFGKPVPCEIYTKK